MSETYFYELIVVWSPPLEWFGRGTRGDKSRAMRTIVEMNVEGKRGRPKEKWSDAIECDFMRELLVCA